MFSLISYILGPSQAISEPAEKAIPAPEVSVKDIKMIESPGTYLSRRYGHD